MAEAPPTEFVPRSDAQVYLTGLAVRIFFPMLVIFVYASVQLLRFGTAGNDFVILLAGAILAFAGVLGKITTILTDQEKVRRRLLLAVVKLPTFIPYLFGLYLVFYRGFWTLRFLRNGFSFAVLTKAAVFVFCGSVLLSKFQQIVDAGRQIKKGEVILSSNLN